MSTPVISIRQLSKRYGKARGIEDVSLDVPENDIFGFIGPNGAGKSTTIRILLNLIFPNSGTARIMDMDVSRQHKSIMQHVGYIPSDANIYAGLKVKEFLRYCSNFYEQKPDTKRVSDLCAWFELDTERNVSELSLGNKKKVSIVQSLIHSPKLLILDEPTTGLDPLMQSRFFELIRNEHKKGMTVFFSSHNLSEVQSLCKSVAIIREGRIIKVEEIDTLRKKQLKKIQIEFSNSSDLAAFSLKDAAQNLIVSGNTASFMYSGDVNDFIKALQNKPIKYLTIEEPSLEEIFMHYYN
jgi:ABC-2 type transport system ATP-binding protein